MYGDGRLFKSWAATSDGDDGLLVVIHTYATPRRRETSRPANLSGAGARIEYRVGTHVGRRKPVAIGSAVWRRTDTLVGIGC